MRNSFLLFIFLSNFSYADYLFTTQNACVKNFYFKGGYLYYTFSHYDVLQQTTDKSLGDKFIDGYEYNVTSNECKKIGANNSLNLPNDMYSSAMALTGLLVGFLLSLFVFIALRLSL